MACLFSGCVTHSKVTIYEHTRRRKSATGHFPSARIVSPSRELLGRLLNPWEGTIVTFKPELHLHTISCIGKA